MSDEQIRTFLKEWDDSGVPKTSLYYRLLAVLLTPKGTRK